MSCVVQRRNFQNGRNKKRLLYIVLLLVGYRAQDSEIEILLGKLRRSSPTLMGDLCGVA